MPNRLNKQDQAILASWKRHEDNEPDISTERLMAMVEDDTGSDPECQLEALRRAGWIKHP